MAEKQEIQVAGAIQELKSNIKKKKKKKKKKEKKKGGRGRSKEEQYIIYI